MYCTCGRKLSEKAKFCPSCGKTVDRSDSGSKGMSGKGLCTSCGAPVTPGYRYCVVCGAPIRESGVADSPGSGNVCKYCYAKLKPPGKFCVVCGREQSESILPAPPDPAPVPPAPPTPIPPAPPTPIPTKLDSEEEFFGEMPDLND